MDNPSNSAQRMIERTTFPGKVTLKQVKFSPKDGELQMIFQFFVGRRTSENLPLSMPQLSKRVWRRAFEQLRNFSIGDWDKWQISRLEQVSITPLDSMDHLVTVCFNAQAIMGRKEVFDFSTAQYAVQYIWSDCGNDVAVEAKP